ncbi:MAG: VOC family protein [Candidatus Thorarchaeota archaeon]|nr:VOC family protein [Candidatus Thorarchaeota archaeon]
MPSVRAITIYVNDMEKAIEFYRDTMGFDIVHSSTTIVHLENDGIPIILEKEKSKSTAKYPGTSQVVIGIETEDLEKTISVLRDLSVNIVHDDPQQFPAGRFMAIRDPAGNVIEILEFQKKDEAV